MGIRLNPGTGTLRRIWRVEPLLIVYSSIAVVLIYESALMHICLHKWHVTQSDLQNLRQFPAALNELKASPRREPLTQPERNKAINLISALAYLET